jgi:hypothetical protein
MKPLAPPEFLTIYMLMQQSTGSMYFCPTGVSSTPSMGSGIYGTRDEAEKARTLAILSDKNNSIFHVFELEVPNPAHK